MKLTQQKCEQWEEEFDKKIGPVYREGVYNEDDPDEIRYDKQIYSNRKIKSFIRQEKEKSFQEGYEKCLKDSSKPLK